MMFGKVRTIIYNTMKTRSAVYIRAFAAPVSLMAVAFVFVLPIRPMAAADSTGFEHIFFVIDENHGYNQIIGNSDAPYINSLASANSLATNYFAIRHPSLPNYLALVGGSTFGISSDCKPSSCPVDAPNLADSIEASGRTWHAYMEGMTTPCQLSDSGGYAQKHNPFIYFNDIRTTSRCAANDVPYTQLATDLGSVNTTSNYNWITPTLCHDMHDCSIATGDDWLQSNLPTIFSSPAWQTTPSLLVLTFDEDNNNESNHIVWLAISSPSAGHLTSSVRYNHYSMLKTIESIWSLPALTSNDGGATAMTDLLGAPSPSSSPSSSPSPSTSPTPSPSPSPTSPPPSSGCNLATPIRATFYYGWYPENWTQNNTYPATRYSPWLGFYDTSSFAVLRSQISAMEYGGIQAAIASWWGQGSNTDGRVAQLLAAAHSTPFCWTLYYEPALSGSQAASDLAYIAAHYANDPNFLHVNGKPVLFIYSRAVASCDDVAAWDDAQLAAGTDFYLNEQVFLGYRDCAAQPSSWHQYAPAVAEDHQAGFSFSISPGFYKYNEAAPRLARDPLRWVRNVADMKISNEPWQLITTFNEWIEGTSIENALDWQSSTGAGVYLDALH
jgi:phosphatidylinositol-3-phosphatase